MWDAFRLRGILAAPHLDSVPFAATSATSLHLFCSSLWMLLFIFIRRRRVSPVTFKIKLN